MSARLRGSIGWRRMWFPGRIAARMEVWDKGMTAPLGMFLLFVLVTLGITYWAARRSQGAAAFFTASRRITGWQNGVAVAGDYMSAASFLGIAGLIAFFGYDGFMFSVGWLVAYLTVLLVVAEPLRNA